MDTRAKAEHEARAFEATSMLGDSGALAIEPAPARVRPLARRLPEGFTPIDALKRVAHEPHTAFFESGGPLASDAQWTLLAFDPLWRLELRAGVLWKVERDLARPLSGKPLAALDFEWPPLVEYDTDELEAIFERTEQARELPFLSGLAGYVGYDFKDHIERYPARARAESRLPDIALSFYDVVWLWEKSSGRGAVVATGLPEADSSLRVERARERLAGQWNRVLDRSAREELVSAHGSSGARAGGSVPPAVRSNFTRDEYRRAVQRALEHIGDGDIYQVNLAQRFSVEPAPTPLELYLDLREESPAPFAAFLSLQEGAVVSSSPERFFRIQGRSIETWPIKGTRPRGTNSESDIAQADALRASPKDRAENVMIVDLERNDLGKICEIGSVRVPALCEVSSYANVHHLVSRVEGTLRPDIRPVDVWRAVHPGGSITGAPKIRSVQIIDALEPTRRGVYTGAIGYWDAAGGCDWNIAIRTIVVESGVASFHAGGGIVADSTPDGEYEETLIKASRMLRALGVDWSG